MKIAIVADHRGFGLKKNLIKSFKTQNFIIEDLGTYSTQKTNYAEYGHKLAKYIINHNDYLGIAICGSGIGISIAANRHRGIRAALVRTTDEASLTKKHNNPNILVLGSHTTNLVTALDIVKVFLEATFEKGRHLERINKIEIKEIEQ